MKYILLITLLFINITNTSAQGISCVWFFGEHAGITFNTADGEPIALTGNQISMREGCSTVSDTNGNFLFYTDGVLVNDRNHNTMPNGTALDGHWWSQNFGTYALSPSQEKALQAELEKLLEEPAPALKKNRNSQPAAIKS